MELDKDKLATILSRNWWVLLLRGIVAIASIAAHEFEPLGERGSVVPGQRMVCCERMSGSGVARVDLEHPVTAAGHNAIEQVYLTGHRWFSVDELRSLPTADGSVLLAPPDLADRLADLLRDGPPASPVLVQGAVLP